MSTNCKRVVQIEMRFVSSVFYVIISIDNIIAISELLAAVAWLSNCARKNSRDSIWAAYHKQLVAHLSLAGVPSPVMATISRRLMECGIAAQAAVSGTPSTEVVCISEEDKDIVEYIAGFAAHRIRQKAFRLKCSGDKTTTLELVSALIRPAGESTSALVNCQQRGGLLSVHGNILQIFNALELMFRQSTNSTITRQIDLQNLVQTAVNDASLLTLYNGCVSDVSATSLRKDDMFKELTLIYFMVRVNVFCRQTMEQFRQTHRMCR